MIGSKLSSSSFKCIELNLIIKCIDINSEDQIKELESKFIKKLGPTNWRYLVNGKWIKKSELKDFQDWCDKVLLGIQSPEDRPKCPICKKPRSFDYQNRRYYASCGNRSCAQIIAMSNEELRDRISRSVTKMYQDHPEVKLTIANSVRQYYQDHPEAGDAHSKRIADMWKDPNSIYNSEQYRSNLGAGISKGLVRAWANPDSGYHDPEVRRRQAEACSKSMSNHIKKHPEFLHARRFSWIDELKKANKPSIFTRSTWELEWIKKLENDVNVISYEWEPVSLRYYNSESKGYRYYVPDVLVHYKDHDELQEIKRNDRLYDQIVIDKTKSAIEWCDHNNATFRFICYSEVFYDIITNIDYSRYK